jgi:hypothetical protein
MISNILNSSLYSAVDALAFGMLHEKFSDLSKHNLNGHLWDNFRLFLDSADKSIKSNFPTQHPNELKIWI